MSRYTYKIFFLKENTQTEHSFLVDASNQKSAKQAFKESEGKLSTIISIQKYYSKLSIPKIQGE